MSVIVFRTDKVEDSQSRLLGGTTGVTTIDTDRGTFVLTTARGQSGMSSYELTADGKLNFVQQVTSAGARHLDGAGDLLTLSTGGKDYVVTTSFYENAVQAYSVSQTGRVTSGDVIFDDVKLDTKNGTSVARGTGDEAALFGADSVSKFVVGGQLHLMVGGTYDNGVNVIRVEDDGGLTLINTLFDTNSTHLKDVDDVDVVYTSKGTYSFAVSPTEGGISVLRIFNNGAFRNTHNVDATDGVQLGRPTSVETVQFDGKTFVYTGGIGNDPISVFQLSDTGRLRLVEQVGGDDAEHIRKTYSMKSFETDGDHFLAVGGDTGGISIFEVANDGTLTLRSEIDHDLPSRTKTTADLEIKTIGDKTFILAAGQDGDGVSVYRFVNDVNGVGVTASSNKSVIKGSFKADVLLGSDGKDVIRAKSGDDLLLDGEHKDKLFGGPGSDVFEFTVDGKQDRVQDFQDGLDLIDLSASSVESLDQIEFTQLTNRAVRLDYDDEILIVRAWNKGDLNMSQLTEDDFIL